MHQVLSNSTSPMETSTIVKDGQGRELSQLPGLLVVPWASPASVPGAREGSSSVPIVLWMIPQEMAPDGVPSPSPHLRMGCCGMNRAGSTLGTHARVAGQHNLLTTSPTVGLWGTARAGPRVQLHLYHGLAAESKGMKRMGWPCRASPPPHSPQGLDRLHQPRKPFLSPLLTALCCFLLPRWSLPVIAGKVTSKLGK